MDGRDRKRVAALKTILVICMAASIATFGLLEGGGGTPTAEAVHPLDGHFDELMPRYPRVAEFPLGETLDMGDGEMQMSYFSTKDPPLRVASYYRTVWEQEGLKVHQHVTPAGGVVGTYDPRIKGARSVTLLVKRGHTWVFPAAVNRPLEATKRGDLGEREGVPAFPGSSRGLTLRTSDRGKGSVVTTYSNSGGLAKNVEFYRVQMGEKGWTEDEVPSFEELVKHRTLSFRQDDQRCTINLTGVGEGDEVIVSVIVESGDDV